MLNIIVVFISIILYFISRYINFFVFVNYVFKLSGYFYFSFMNKCKRWIRECFFICVGIFIFYR